MGNRNNSDQVPLEAPFSWIVTVGQSTGIHRGELIAFATTHRSRRHLRAVERRDQCVSTAPPIILISHAWRGILGSANSLNIPIDQTNQTPSE